MFLALGIILVLAIIFFSVYNSLVFKSKWYKLSLALSALSSILLLIYAIETFVLHTKKTVCLNKALTDKCFTYPSTHFSFIFYAFILSGVALLISYYKHSKKIGYKNNSAAHGMNWYAVGSIVVFILGYLDSFAGYYGWFSFFNNANNNNSLILFYFLSVLFVIFTFYAFYPRKKSLGHSAVLTLSATVLAFMIVEITAIFIALSAI